MLATKVAGVHRCGAVVAHRGGGWLEAIQGFDPPHPIRPLQVMGVLDAMPSSNLKPENEGALPACCILLCTAAVQVYSLADLACCRLHC